MFHLIWYVLVGLLAGVIAKSVMHAHMTIFWTIVLGIIGSIIGGAVTHMFMRPKNERFHPAGLIFSTLGAILVLFICYKSGVSVSAVVEATEDERRRLGFRWPQSFPGRNGRTPR